MKIKSKILIIAGSDSSGGAGIQADIKTASSLGVYAMTAVTAVTVQNTKSVKSVISVPANEIYNQIIHTTTDIKPRAIKIGMLHSTQVINKVIQSLEKIKIKKIILDPVMVAKGGSKLISEQAIKLMKTIPEILECHYTTGNWSVLIKILCKDNEHLMLILNKKIQSINGVSRTETFISLEQQIDRQITIN